MSTPKNLTRFFDQRTPDLQQWARVDPDQHPLARLEQAAGITAKEAARRLGISVRQYMRYKSGKIRISDTVLLLIDSGALTRPRTELAIERELQKWHKRSNTSND